MAKPLSELRTHLKRLTQDPSFKGQWRIGKDNRISYKREGKREEIKLKAALVGAESNALIVSVEERQTSQKTVTRLVRLKGVWYLDRRNRLVFEVAKEGGKKDILTFQGAWRIGQKSELIFTSYRQILKTKRKERGTLVFKGYWDFSDDHRLTYFLKGSTTSEFRFRGTFQTKSILAKKGALRYQIGVEVRGKRRVDTLVLLGKWKVSRHLALAFEIEYSGGRKKSINFGTEYSWDGKSRIHVYLKDKRGRPLGLEIILTRDFLDRQKHAFVRLEKSVPEFRVEGGITKRW